MHPQLLDRPDGTAAREHTGAAQDAAPAAQHTARPRLAPASASAADSRAPRDSETDRGGGGRRRQDSPSVASPARPMVPTVSPQPSGPRGNLIRSY